MTDTERELAKETEAACRDIAAICKRAELLNVAAMLERLGRKWHRAIHDSVVSAQPPDNSSTGESQRESGVCSDPIEKKQSMWDRFVTNA